MAESIMDTATRVRVTKAGAGTTDSSLYNRAVNNVNVTNIHNTYNTTVINNTTVNRVSYNGGTGGITARPTAQEETAAHEKHIAPVAAQTQHEQAARANPQQRAVGEPGEAAPSQLLRNREHSVPVYRLNKQEHLISLKPRVRQPQPPAKTPPAQPANNVPRPRHCETE